MKVFVIIKFLKDTPSIYEIYKVCQEYDAMELARDFDGDEVWDYSVDECYVE
jgi:hypothetical protein